MKPINLLSSLYKREHSGSMKLKKPIYSFSLSEKMHYGRLNDIFLGFTVNCDFIVSLTFEHLDPENFYIHSFSNIYLNFNTSPMFDNQMTVFHKINLGFFQQSMIHIHFYQNVLNPDFFVFIITEMDSDIILILFGNLPQIHCIKCQTKTCDKHGIIAKQSYQFPISKLNYSNKFHQVSTVYHQDHTLVVVLGDCESNIRFITIQFPDDLEKIQYCKYPKSMFPFSLSVSNKKIIENDCSCFYDNVLINEKCKLARMNPIKSVVYNEKCQLCFTKSININDTQFYYHEEIPNEIIDSFHSVNASENPATFKRILLTERESVVTCQPCNKKSFLTDIGASYQSLVLYKLNLRKNAFVNWDFDCIHGEIQGSSDSNYSKNYQWVTNNVKTTGVAIITEELVINSGLWFPALDSEVEIHCLGMATGKLSYCKALLVHVLDECNNMSYLVELDINTGIKKILLQETTSLEFCKFVKDVQICCNHFVLDLNNDVQVSTGNSLDSVKDYSGLIEMKH